MIAQEVLGKILVLGENLGERLGDFGRFLATASPQSWFLVPGKS